MTSQIKLAKKIYEENRDLLVRANKETIDSDYIKEEDVLMIYIGSQKAVSLSYSIAKEHIIVHYNPKNFKITGFTIPYLKEFVKWHQKLINGKKSVEEVYKTKPKEVVDTVASTGITGLQGYAYA